VSDQRGVAIVWPVAANTGGVELIAREALEYFATRRPTTFVGTSMSPRVHGIRHLAVPAGSGHVRRPVGFRVRSQRALRSLSSDDVVVSMGANCAPGQVRWVHSVHAAYLRLPGRMHVGPVQVSARWRRALPRHRALLALERDYFRRHPPAQVLATSEQERADLVELYGVEDEAIHVVGNGYNPHRFSAEHRTRFREQIRDRLGVRPDQLSVLFAANELHRKGFMVLLRALRLLRSENVRVDVVGRADPAGLVAAARSDGWVPDVHWHGTTPAIEDFYAAADAMVLPTYYEPFGLVIVEALATGLPVVTTRTAGASPYVTADCGRVQEDPESAEELAEILRGFLEPSVLASASSAAPAAVRKLEWPAVLGRVEKLIYVKAGSEATR